MLVAYGYTVKGLDDEFIALAKETSQITGQAMAPGWLVDSFPICRACLSFLAISAHSQLIVSAIYAFVAPRRWL